MQRKGGGRSRRSGMDEWERGSIAGERGEREEERELLGEILQSQIDKVLYPLIALPTPARLSGTTILGIFVPTFSPRHTWHRSRSFLSLPLSPLPSLPLVLSLSPSLLFFPPPLPLVTFLGGVIILALIPPLSYLSLFPLTNPTCMRLFPTLF